MLIDVGNALACGCCVCSWGAKCTDLPWSLALALGHIHTSYVVYVHGGWSALTLSDGPDVGDKRG